jgi:hypothetical protein
VALTSEFTGPGALSLDALLGHYLSGTPWSWSRFSLVFLLE